MHFYTWKSGLKTGLYYLRTRSSAIPLQYTVPLEFCDPHDLDGSWSDSSPSSYSSSSVSPPLTPLHLQDILNPDVIAHTHDTGVLASGNFEDRLLMLPDEADLPPLVYPHGVDPGDVFSPVIHASSADDSPTALDMSALFSDGFLGMSDHKAPCCVACGA